MILCTIVKEPLANRSLSPVVRDFPFVLRSFASRRDVCVCVPHSSPRRLSQWLPLRRSSLSGRMVEIMVLHAGKINRLRLSITLDLGSVADGYWSCTVPFSFFKSSIVFCTIFYLVLCEIEIGLMVVQFFSVRPGDKTVSKLGTVRDRVGAALSQWGKRGGHIGRGRWTGNGERCRGSRREGHVDTVSWEVSLRECSSIGYRLQDAGSNGVCHVVQRWGAVR